jgi:hypothetical protein
MHTMRVVRGFVPESPVPAPGDVGKDQRRVAGSLPLLAMRARCCATV